MYESSGTEQNLESVRSLQNVSITVC